MWCHGTVWGHDGAVLEVVAEHGSALAGGDAASQGVLGAGVLAGAVLPRPAALLEFIPGMVVTQHSGEGKANQYFLRGMNLDHGTDFATSVNGVPVNLPTHAHGQGYSDLNLLIPELVGRVEYRKGPYAAADGDFASAGAADIVYRTRLDRPLADVTLGQRGYQRALVAGSVPLQDDRSLLLALERVGNDGPWRVPEGLRKTNAQLILSGGSPREGWSLSLSDHAARWHATEQVPLRLLQSGVEQGRPFGRFDSLDPSDGADTRRTSLSGAWHAAGEDQRTQLQWYALRYRLDLFSNFTYHLYRASDQLGQSDDRTVWGARASHTWLSTSSAGLSWQHTLGGVLRQDRIQLGLFDAVDRQRIAPVREDAVQQTALGLWGETAVGWTPWLRTVAGARLDRLQARVDSALQPLNSGAVSALRASPRVSLVLGPWRGTELFVHAGSGFHSNDARGATTRMDPRTDLPLAPAPLLAGTRGQEIGLKARPLAGWLTTLALWRLDMASELVYQGDTGSTTAGRPSRRTGLEWGHQWDAGEHWGLHASLAWTRPRYTDASVAGQAIANALQQVAHLNLRLRQLGPWSGALDLRYMGAAPLSEDGRVRAPSSLRANLQIRRRMSEQLELALEVLNLTDRVQNEIAYFYPSRLLGEPAGGVPDVHLHPAEPRSFRLTARLRW